MYALAATDAMVGLTKLRYAPVVPDKKSPTLLGIFRVFCRAGHVALVYTFVVMREYPWNVNTVRAWHAIFAIVAGDGVLVIYLFGNIVFKKEHFFFCEWL